jgi:hypothetical protein
MRIALCLALLACGSSSKPTTTTPTPTESTGDCEPGRCLEDISKTVAEHKPAARKCAGTASGRVIINFKIGKDGSVEEADQGMREGQISDPAVVGCLTDVIKNIKFAASSKTTRAYHEFEFGGQ